jgi:hypothetical protein
MYPLLKLQFLQNNAGDGVQGLGLEPLGSKRKFWGLLENQPDRPWLFKYARPDTGEHWAEKIASELAALMDFPAAKVELATVNGELGALVRSILPYEAMPGEKFPIRRGDLIHGNEILGDHLPKYETRLQWGQMDHTWNNIQAALERSVTPSQLSDSLLRFAGMVLFDAWIGNTDRHHENWAILVTPDGEKSLAPSYDHASALGRELADQRREEFMRLQKVSDYVRKARGGIYGYSTGKHAESPLNLAAWAAEKNPSLFKPWLNRIRDVSSSQIRNLVEQVPREVMSNVAAEFCVVLLTYTKEQLSRLLV